MSDPVVVVGAGPFGLSVAANLRARGTGTRVFGVTMGSWSGHMPAGMFLKSTPSASNLDTPSAGATLDDYCRAAGISVFDEYHDAIPIESFIEYGRWFAQQHVPDVEDRTVSGVTRTARGFDVATADGEAFAAKAVIVASGHVSHAYVPPELSAMTDGVLSPDGPVSHASQHADLSGYSGKRVAVIGGGQSALESAALLHESGADVVLLVRAKEVIWGGPDSTPTFLEKLRQPPSGLGPGWAHRLLTDGPLVFRLLPAATRRSLVKNILGPFGSWWLRDRVDGPIETQVGTHVTRADAGDDGRVRLELAEIDGSVAKLDVDHVIAATGYRVDIARIPYLDRRVVEALRTVPGCASPALGTKFESSVPGLYFTGLAAAMTFGPLMRFVHGVHFAAPRIAASAASEA
jgi:cation diffusion facilitator CzcD-associated flavoprotein CzcO